MEKLKVTEWKEPNFYREDLVQQITDNFSERCEIRKQVYFYILSPSDFGIIDKKFYCEELKELVKAHALKHLEFTIKPNLENCVQYNRTTVEQAQQVMQNFSNNIKKMLGIIQQEITKSTTK